jgi:hypothetical protein
MTAQSWGVALANPDTVAPPSFARCWIWRCAPRARLLIGPGGATIDAGGDVSVADTGHITCRNSRRVGQSDRSGTHRSHSAVRSRP